MGDGGFRPGGERERPSEAKNVNPGLRSVLLSYDETGESDENFIRKLFCCCN